MISRSIFLLLDGALILSIALIALPAEEVSALCVAKTWSASLTTLSTVRRMPVRSVSAARLM
jgi:hypothetical protein